ncbi:MAG: hypothetical protein JO129_01820 [Candidatus Dependentiae bacterium]|nr:hypothetical protein [Candidatus Dependentiae bacterium]
MKQFINSLTIFNKMSKTKTYSWVIAVLAILFCYNASMVTNNSAESSTEPDVNFYGILEDHVHTTEVESILIDGRYKDIPVYQQVVSPTQQDKTAIPTQEIDPKQNKTLINLQDIKSISLEHPNNPTASSIKVNNRVYIQIIVELLHGTKKKYLVESTRKITCKEIDKSADIQEKPTLQTRNINFIHVKKLTIKGFKSNQPYKAREVGPISKESEKPTLHQEKNKLQHDAAQLLNSIEENVKNLPIDNPSAFETMRSTILVLLKSLRDQLQKFLDMIK